MAADEETPSATLYLRNLDEKLSINRLKKEIMDIFGEFGDIIDIVAKKNIRAKGQAFVVFSSVEEASEAKDVLNGFDLNDRPMDIQFAKTRSDATVKQTAGEISQEFEEHKQRRLAEKERKNAQRAAEEAAKPVKRPAEELAERPVKRAMVAATADEYLPPNKILILRELPEDYTKEAITAVFGRFPGLKEIRMVPGRKGLAFAEYEDETASAVARDAMNGAELAGKTLRVTFQKS